MRELVDDPGRRARLATEARQVVRQRTWAQLVDQLIAVHYAAVLGPDSTLAAA